MKINKRFLLKVGAVLALIVLMATTAYAFSLITYQVKENYFQTGHVEVAIEFTDPVDPALVNLKNQSIKFEPGMRVRGGFRVTNLSEGDGEEGIWYRIYFTNVKGGLANVMEATVYDGTEVLCSGKIKDWTNNRTMMNAQILASKGEKDLVLELHFPEEAGNVYQADEMQYQLAVVAVQRRNNPDQEFEPYAEYENKQEVADGE